MREMKTQIRALRKHVAEKEQMTDILKNPWAYSRNHISLQRNDAQ